MIEVAADAVGGGGEGGGQLNGQLLQALHQCQGGHHHQSSNLEG